MEEAPENGKESLNSAHADGMNEHVLLSTFLEPAIIINPLFLELDI
jgi:hypothetical protein